MAQTAFVGGIGPARGETSFVFTATSNAHLIGMEVSTAPSVVFDPLLDPGQAVAQAEIDSLGSSKGFAAEVSPGGTVLAVPGLLGTLTNGRIGSQLPAMPLVVASDNPSVPAKRQAVGTVAVETSSSSRSSTSSATDGVSRAAASAMFDPGNGRVVATAESTVGEVALGDVLVLDGVRSAARVEQDSSGRPVRSSSFDVGSLSIMGQRVAVTRGGLQLLGTNVPIGSLATSVPAPLFSALAQRGVTVDFLPATDLPDGVRSAGLRITIVAKPPPSIIAGLASITVVLTLGGNVASVSNRTFAVPVGADAAASIAIPPDAAAVMPSGTSGLGLAAGAPPVIGPSAPVSQAAVPPAAVAGSSVAERVSIARFYLVLVLVGGVIYAAFRLFRRFGVVTR